MYAARDETGDVSDVRHVQGAHLVGNLLETIILPEAGIGGGAGDNQLRAMLTGQTGHLIEVNPLGPRVYAIVDEVVELGGKVDR